MDSRVCVLFTLHCIAHGEVHGVYELGVFGFGDYHKTFAYRWRLVSWMLYEECFIMDTNGFSGTSVTLWHLLYGTLAAYHPTILPDPTFRNEARGSTYFLKISISPRTSVNTGTPLTSLTLTVPPDLSSPETKIRIPKRDTTPRLMRAQIRGTVQRLALAPPHMYQTLLPIRFLEKKFLRVFAWPLGGCEVMRE